MTIPGGYADYLKIPRATVSRSAAWTWRRPRSPAARRRRARRADLRPRDRQRVLVLGAGTIGLMAVVAARAGGAGEILVTARRPQQKAAALALGADRVFDDAAEGALFEAAGESPIDLVVESVGGTASTLDTAVAACRPGGTICLLGVYTKSIPFPALFTVAKELTIKGSFVYNRAGSRPTSLPSTCCAATGRSSPDDDHAPVPLSGSPKRSRRR
jgi:threonine dehydrogenase-like Zn-dependent dehydrogenase